MTRVVVVGTGVAGSEVGTHIARCSAEPVEVVEIEYEPRRRHGGWGFQKFPSTETTNLAMRKMYLGEKPDDIFHWASRADRSLWTKEHQAFEFHPDKTFPRCLMQEYVKWRRRTSMTPLNSYVTFNEVQGEAVYVRAPFLSKKIYVDLRDGRTFDCDAIVMASGSISVKVPPYLNHLAGNSRVILDPLDLPGHESRARIPSDASVLVLGTGLTGEEQISVLHKQGHQNMTLFSRGGQRHFRYEETQTNKELVLNEPPTFLHSETPEEFNEELSAFFARYLAEGHSPEDIFAAVRPFWDQMRADLGGCYKAADRLREFRRTLATNSIGCPSGVCEIIEKTQAEGRLTILHGSIHEVREVGNKLEVDFDDRTEQYDYIINAVGRNIIRHEVWDRLLEDGLAKKHAGIGVRVSERGRMIDAEDREHNKIWVVGMARAGDHALRHGFLGNTAFNVPQVRSHLYETIDDLIHTIIH